MRIREIRVNVENGVSNDAGKRRAAWRDSRAMTIILHGFYVRSVEEQGGTAADLGNSKHGSAFR